MARWKSYKIFVSLCVCFVSLWFNSNAQRRDILLKDGWVVSVDKEGIRKEVSIPHNLDAYDGYRRLVHGNKHGEAGYARTVPIKKIEPGKRYFLYFEGVGSYAKVFFNGVNVGEHAGGRTSFSIDITDQAKASNNNSLLVEASHPAHIQDLPWVCGGCSEERGFSEGSQPFGIFRPVHLIITNDVRIEPFGVHAWADFGKDSVKLNIETTVKNYSGRKRNIQIIQQLIDRNKKTISTFSTTTIEDSSIKVLCPITNIPINTINKWSVKNPYLYTIKTTIKENGTHLDELTTDFGFRTIEWSKTTHQFLLNGEPVFINGIAEYEHLLGQSHAFSNEQIQSRFKWIEATGFNAFRDGHQPHNLLYGKLCNQKGILWWTQFSAHVWYDTKAFRDNFKQLLKEWVIERRNDPSVILWGLQNESQLPEDFAKECTELIRSLDPTASKERLVTTCNGGTGTDWDVPQNWTGTYGGNPATYGEDLKKQILVGEYGAWRTIDLHTEGGFVQNGLLSEDRMVQLMEQKIRLAEKVKDSVAGHFFWLLTSHDNPGRVQGGEGLRELDRIGPVNYKGLFTPWEEPTDAFYMYRSNYADKYKEPMVYIVSHTWPNRWMQDGVKDSLYVYSNCDEVELFNDIDSVSLGKRNRNGTGTHFIWDKVDIQYNVLYAVGYVNGKAVARDTITLFHLPPAPHFNKLYTGAKNITKGKEGYEYIYRVNCGGPDYTDINGNRWQSDHPITQSPNNGSYSWANDFPELPSFFASQRRTFSPIKGTKDWKLFQTFRYGREKLKFDFDIEDGEYLIELYFTEPWLNIGGGMNARGMRLFDVAVNRKTVLNDFDIWHEAGTNGALKKSFLVKAEDGKLVIHFPESKSGQALISAIAVARKAKSSPEARFIQIGRPSDKLKFNHWLDIGDLLYSDPKVQVHRVPPNLFGADWLQLSMTEKKTKLSFEVSSGTDLFIGLRTDYPKLSSFPEGFEDTKTELVTDEYGGRYYKIYRKRFDKSTIVQLNYDYPLLVIQQPVNQMQPAYDLKPVTQYKTNVVVFSEGVMKDSVNGRYCAVVNTHKPVSVDYPIQTGVGDVYSITVKYFYGKENTVKGKLQLIDAGGNRMMEENISFSFTKPGKWNQFTVNTGTQINAGNYSVRLIVENGEGLALSGIDIQ